jgi:hypothetical protein
LILLAFTDTGVDFGQQQHGLVISGDVLHLQGQAALLRLLLFVSDIHLHLLAQFGVA